MSKGLRYLWLSIRLLIVIHDVYRLLNIAKDDVAMAVIALSVHTTSVI